MLGTLSSIGLLLAFGSFATQTAAATQAPQAQVAAANPAIGPSSASDPAREQLEAELERQRQIAKNARYQVERLRAEIALKDELLELGRQRNRELYDTGNEILDRYAGMDFGDVLSAREPFVQKGRVELENLVQDYEDALRAARFTEDTLPPSVEERMHEELAEAQASGAGETPQDTQSE